MLNILGRLTRSGFFGLSQHSRIVFVPSHPILTISEIYASQLNVAPWSYFFNAI